MNNYILNVFKKIYEFNNFILPFSLLLKMRDKVNIAYSNDHDIRC